MFPILDGKQMHVKLFPKCFPAVSRMLLNCFPKCFSTLLLIYVIHDLYIYCVIHFVYCTIRDELYRIFAPSGVSSKLIESQISRTIISFPFAVWKHPYLLPLSYIVLFWHCTVSIAEGNRCMCQEYLLTFPSVVNTSSENLLNSALKQATSL